MRVKRLYVKTGILVLGLLSFMAVILVTAREIREENRYKKSIMEPLKKQYPEIDNPKLSMYEKANILREFTYRNSVFANGSEVHLDLNEYLKRERGDKAQASALFSVARDKEGGFYCQGFATMLTLLYRNMGYEAVNLGMTVDGDNSHVLTLVRIGDKWIAQDATFNQVYVDEEDRPLDIREIITYLKAKEDKKICTKEGDYKYRYASSRYPPDKWRSMYPFVEVLEEDEGEGLYFYRIDGTREHYGPMDEPLRLALYGEGYPADEKYIFLYAKVIAAGEPKEYEGALQEEIDRLQKE